ncbi:MAG: bacillithiol biosynthesis deacetylase BshB1 [Ignavibacteria bacterium]|nr:bacillithiol biosynthesis deacetylase BshB1 [Ignavibacteria bacterium]
MKADVLVICAHPDDAELSCAGTIKKLTNEGRRVVFVECTRAELGTRGTPEIREAEAASAAAILGVHAREQLGIPDGGVEDTLENAHKLVVAIRAWKPTLVLIPSEWERHPDHEAVHAIARRAAFLSGLVKITTTRDGVEQAPHRPKRMLCYQQFYDFPGGPDLFVDVTETFGDKMNAIRAFSSQFHVPEHYTSNEPETLLSNPEFLLTIEARERYYGSRIGVTYAEGFKTVGPLGVSSLGVFL